MKIFRYKDILIVTIAAISAAIFLKAFVIDAVYVPSASMKNELLPGDFILVNKLSFGRFHEKKEASSQASFFLPDLSASANVTRGDVIIFKFNGDDKQALVEDQSLFVKRCVGIAGDMVEIDHGQIFVNGKRIYLPNSKKSSSSKSHNSEVDLFPQGAGYTLENYGPIKVPKKGDQVELTKENFKTWESLIRHEGHSISLSSKAGILIDGYKKSSYTVEKNYLFVLGDNFYESYDSRFWGFVPDDNVLGEALFVYWSVKPDNRSNTFMQNLNAIRWDRIGSLVR